MLYRLLRPLLFQLPAEPAHELALGLTARFAAVPPLARLAHRLVAADDPVTLAGLTFPNRVGLAGGMDKNAVAPLAWWACGFGFVELGTVTPQPQPGNPKPRMFRLPARRAILNRMGFNNDGAESVAARLQEQKQHGRRPPFPIGVSVGKQFSTPVDDILAVAADYQSAAAVVAPVSDFVSINISSPNTSGLRTLQTGEAVRVLVRAVRGVIGSQPLLVKVAPELDGSDLTDVLDAALGEGATGVIATNTLGYSDAARGKGGLSGRPLTELSRERVRQVRRHVGDGVLVIGVGGIDSVPTARAMLDAGADLIQLYSGLVYEGPLLPARLARGLRRPPQVA